MVNSNSKKTLNEFFSTFMQQFYKVEDVKEKLYIDSFLQQSIIVPGRVSSVNHFLYNAANRYFTKEGDRFVEKGDVYASYCGFVDAIKVDERIKAVQERDDYQNALEKYTSAAQEHSKVQDELDEKRDEGIARIEKRLKVGADATPEEKRAAQQEILQAKKKFIMNFKDPSLAARLSKAKGAEDNAQHQMIILEDKYGVTGDIKMVLRSKLKCKKAAKDEMKNAYNMGYEDAIAGFGEYVPSIGSNTNALEHVGERVFKNIKINDEIKAALQGKTDSKKPSAASTTTQSGSDNSQDKIVEANKEYFKEKQEIEGSQKSPEQKASLLALLKQKWYDDSILANIVEGRSGADKRKAEAQKGMIEAQMKARNKFLELDNDEKLEECMNNNIYHMFSKTHVDTAKTAASVGGGALLWSASAAYTRDRTDASKDAACISFESIMKVPVRYNWLSKNVLKDIDFDKSSMSISDESGGLKLNSKEFLNTPCYIIKDIIIGTNMKSYFADETIGEIASSFSSEASYDTGLWSVKGGISRDAANINKEQEKTGFNVPDYIVVLGYELEQVCGLGSSSIFDRVVDELSGVAEELSSDL